MNCFCRVYVYKLCFQVCDILIDYIKCIIDVLIDDFGLILVENIEVYFLVINFDLDFFWFQWKREMINDVKVVNYIVKWEYCYV